MKILHVIESGGLYGAENVVLDLASVQKLASDLPTIMSVGPHECEEKPIESAAFEREIDLKQWRMRRGFNWMGTRRILRWARERKFDVLHSHSYRFDTLFALADPLSNIPRISTVHGATLNHRGKYRLPHKLSLFFQCMMATTVFVSERSRRQLGLFARRGVVIENGIAIERLRSLNVTSKTEVAGVSSRPDELQLLSVGRMSYEKNQALLLETVRELLDRNVPCHLTHLGEGPLRRQLVDRSRDLELNNVTFAGYVRGVQKHLRASDVLVVTSRVEGMPIAIVEALLEGIPVVATAVGGIPEMLKDYPLSRTTDEHTPTALADQILNVCQPGKRQRASAGTIESMEQRFSAERMADEYRREYSRVVR